MSGIKTIFRYLKGTIDLGLFYPYREKAKYEKLAAFGTADDDDRPVEVQPSNGRHSDRKVLTPYTENPCDVLVGFADAGYLSDPHNGCSQIGYVFTMGNTAISWRSTKQTLVATSSNHAEIIVLHEIVNVYG